MEISTDELLQLISTLEMVKRYLDTRSGDVFLEPPYVEKSIPEQVDISLNLLQEKLLSQ